ncbi:hypothetical protein OOK31_37020 [Streptomyces sp. NBC_00249]|uniref:hypothetical protein n=1 Tax=Streptomyces sp. NBC_00249 TaxID=2975690 RepID=UPI002252CA15|nr:hypothetical protein [Streptomyces sp. NBC_00249]MCX5199416.1 hypothetical protein [Streptomyces sp. NBC_00249]
MRCGSDFPDAEIPGVDPTGGIMTSTGREPDEDPIVVHHVTLAFQPGPPGVKGAWADAAVADMTFRGFVGRYAGQEGDVRIELW